MPVNRPEAGGHWTGVHSVRKLDLSIHKQSTSRKNSTTTRPKVRAVCMAQLTDEQLTDEHLLESERYFATHQETIERELYEGNSIRLEL